MSMNSSDNRGFDRRTLLRRSLLGAGALPMLSGLAASAAAAPEPGPVVDTAAGKVRGATVKGVNIFRGVPYGGPTEGARRFLAPQKPKPWTGVRDALRNGPISAQIEERLNDVAIDEIMGRSPRNNMSENCLNLNLWTAGTTGKRPVMVWFHGGGFTCGSALEPAYDGFNPAAKNDVVMVTINHRLGPFGFMYLDHLNKKYTGSGNAGVQDLVLALEWVRDNIANFGGDPGNVTIFGQSGGGQKVCTVLTMPSSKGLVHKGIAESGAIVRLKTPEEAIEETGMFLKEFGLAPNQVDRLQQLPTYRILEAHQALMDRTGGRSGALVGPSVEDLERFVNRKVPNHSPVVDGGVLPAHPFAAPGATADVPLIVGSNRDEAQVTFLVGPEEYKAPTAEIMRAKAKVFNGEKGVALAELYLKKNPGASFEDALVASSTECRQRAAVHVLSERQVVQGKAPLFVYRTDWRSPVVFRERKVRAAHGVELSMVFDSIDRLPGATGGGPKAQAIAGKMSRAWAAFAHSGNPDAEGIPHWPAFTADTRATMLFDDECKVANDPDREERLLAKG